jgi:hypothetical protein
VARVRNVAGEEVYIAPILQYYEGYIYIVISSQVLFHDGSLLHSNVQYTTVDYN